MHALTHCMLFLQNAYEEYVTESDKQIRNCTLR